MPFWQAFCRGSLKLPSDLVKCRSGCKLNREPAIPSLEETNALQKSIHSSGSPHIRSPHPHRCKMRLQAGAGGITPASLPAGEPGAVLLGVAAAHGSRYAPPRCSRALPATTPQFPAPFPPTTTHCQSAARVAGLRSAKPTIGSSFTTGSEEHPGISIVEEQEEGRSLRGSPLVLRIRI